MFCVNCGKKLEQGDRFCTVCGWPVEQEESGGMEVREDIQPPVEEGTAEGIQPPVSETEGAYQPPASEAEGAYQPPVTGEEGEYQPPVTGGEEAYQPPVSGEETGYQPPSWESPVENTQVTPQGGYYQAPGQSYGQAYGYNGTPQGNVPGMGYGKPEKKKGVWKKVLLIAAPVLLLAVLIGGFSSFGANFFRKTFSSPEGYFQYVMKKAVRENARTASNIYNNLVKENLNFTDKSISGAVTLRLEEEGRDFLEDIDIVDDAGWLEEVTLETDASVKDKVISATVALKLGQDEVLSGNAVVDANKDRAYVQVPSLSDTYLGAETEDLMYELSYYLGDMDFFEFWDTLYECCPDKKTVEKLLYKYSCLAISCIDDVEKSKDTVEAGDVSQKCLSLKATINTKTLQNMLETVLKEMREDEELKKIMKDLSALEGMEDLYDDYRDLLDELLDEVEDIDLYEKIILEVYVNGKGELIGFQIEYDELRILSVKPRDGKKFGLEISYESYADGVKLEGTGKESGNKASGEFEVKVETYYGSERIRFRLEDVDTEAIEEGNVKGTFILPLKEIDDIFGLDNRMLRKYEMVLSADMDESKQKAELILMNDKDQVASILFDFKTGSGKKADLPKNADVIIVEDGDDLEDWLDTIDVDRFIRNLEKTEMPSDMVDEIEDLLDWIL